PQQRLIRRLLVPEKGPRGGWLAPELLFETDGDVYYSAQLGRRERGARARSVPVRVGAVILRPEGDGREGDGRADGARGIPAAERARATGGDVEVRGPEGRGG